ncbi:MAG: hypothetical protein H0T79_21885 [Deltaproteobacteria bacterium]|nr:hypothetical protein [Deltaproteobacteria bacterium]
MMRSTLFMLTGLAILTACGTARSDVAPDRPPIGKLAAVTKDRLCVTKGKLGDPLESGHPVDVPTMRLVAPGTNGDAASIKFWFRGDTTDKRDLATGGARRQIGLKLRAENGCNLVYVMWRLDPKPMLDISVKRNPGQKSHEECGAGGYTKIKPDKTKTTPVPALRIGATHALRAEIKGDTLTAWIDDKIAWQGNLTKEARTLVGPAGVRSDNLAFDLVELLASASDTGPVRCQHVVGD